MLAELYCFRLVRPSVRPWSLTQSFLIGFFPIFIYGLLSSTSHSSSNMGFVRRTITMMADKWPLPISVGCRGHSNLVIFYRISSKFHVWIASIKLLFNFEYKFSLTKDNQDGRQNGRSLSICFCGQSTLIVYYPITSKFHIWITFIKLSVCPITKMAAKMATTYQFTLVDTLT